MERLQNTSQSQIFKQQATAAGKGACVVALTMLALVASALVIHRGFHIIASHHRFWGVEMLLTGAGMALGTAGTVYCATRCGAKRFFTYTGQDKDDLKTFMKGAASMLSTGAFAGFCSPLALIVAVNTIFSNREPNPCPVRL